MKYRYEMFTTLSFGLANDDFNEKELLNTMGEHGWELISVIPVGDFRVHYFKQEVL